jgi:hypothetical protein
MDEEGIDLSPELRDTPPERRSSHRNDDETVGSMPPGTMGMVTIERRIIIRVPMMRMVVPQAPAYAPKAAPPPALARQKTTCLSLKTLKGASINDHAGILFVTASDSRYQAALERGCRPMDFQSGFYLGSTQDGAVCAGRDMLYARSGLRCTITGFTRLLPGM